MPHSQNLKYAQNIGVFSPDDNALIFRVHAKEAARMVRDGQAEPLRRGERVRELVLTATTRHLPTSPCTPASIRDYAGRPTTYRQRLMEPTDDGRAVAVGVVLQLRRVKSKDWPIYRAAVVDCLPATQQAQIRELFAS